MGRRAGLPIVFRPPGRTVYLCRFTVNGHRYRLSTGARDRGAAERAAQHLHAKASLGQLAPSRSERAESPRQESLSLLAGIYLDAVGARRAKSYVVKQEQHLGAQFTSRWSSLDDITSSSIEAWQTERARQVSATTLYKELVTLSQFLKWCKRNGHLQAVPEFDRPLPITDYQPPDLTAEDIAALLAELPDRHTHHTRRPVREFYAVQWSQSLRPGDVAALRWQDVDLKRGLLTIRPTTDKARTGRRVGLAKLAKEVLASLAAERTYHPATPVFGRCSFRRSLALAAKRSGLARHITPHHLRHARLSELASNTRDLAALQFAAGHKRISTTDRYVRSRTERTVKLFAEADSGTSGVRKRRKRGAKRKGARE